MFSFSLPLMCSRQVQPEEGKKLAEEWNCAWTEASARLNENVSKAFELALGELEKLNAPPTEDKSKCTIS
jgi:Ras homolog enriched in brain